MPKQSLNLTGSRHAGGAETAFEQKSTDSVHVETQSLNIDIDLTKGSHDLGYVGMRTFGYDSTLSPVCLKCFVQ
jgi:hypothetical protein